MSRAQNKTDRWMKIEALLLSHPEGLTQSEIARRLDVHRSIINRDLYDFGKQFPIINHEDGRISIDRSAYLIKVTFSLHEAMAVHLASRLLATRMDKHNPHAAAALRKLGVSLEKLAPRISDHVKQSADVMDEADQRQDPRYLEVLERLTLAWAELRKAKVWHRSEKTGKVFEYLLCPYFIEPYAVGQTTHLIGRNDPQGKMRTLKIERIERVELTSDRYEIPADFDPRTLLSDAWGIWYTENEPVEVTLKFHPRVAQRVRETRWHRSEEETELQDGYILWKAKVAEPQEMIPWIRAWGADCEVVEPEELRQALVKETRRMAQVYGVVQTQQDPNIARLLRLWGKTVKDSQDPNDFHPAVFHMLDVGNVARELLSGDASPRWRCALANALNADADTLVNWLPYLIALHDIGKISAAFQGKNDLQRQRLRREKFDFGKWSWAEDLPHNFVSRVFLTGSGDGLAMPEHLRQAWFDTLGGHHGRFCGNEVQGETLERMKIEPSEWSNLRSDIAQVLKRRLLQNIPTWAEPANLSAAAMALTGFVILCDWLGSDKVFKHRPDVPIDDYADESVRHARDVVQAAGFFQPTFSEASVRFRELFPDKTPARDLQLAIDDIPTTVLAAPCLAIIEAPTGEGKTEAALALARRIAQTNGTDELYYALPTMATGNRMYVRLQEHLRERLHLPSTTKLVHGLAFLVEEDLRIEPMSNGDKIGEKKVLQWIGADKRKALMMPFGVGTIDQAELAALNVRFVALRLAGLAGKVVVLDEVHAYDTYMTTIIKRLLEWLAPLGTSVVLLSATLPLSRRQELITAYGGEINDADQDLKQYPKISIISKAGRHDALPQVSQSNQRRVEIDKTLHFTDDDVETKALWLLNEAAKGKCVCWITNTVERAQRMFEKVDSLSAPQIDRMLLHARLPLDKRREREDNLDKKYGPPKPDSQRPRNGGIVIGTQVLEQSLDLDFDVMVSDLAPIDLLLQRAGRLHRHERGDRGIPRLWINAKVDADGNLELDNADKEIYTEFLLRQTWLTLQGRATFNLPDDYRPLIEAVYAVPEPPQDSPLRDAWDKLKAKKDKAIAEADWRLIPECSAEYSFTDALGDIEFVEDENSAAWMVAQTRFGEESINIIPLERDGDRAWCVTANNEKIEVDLNEVPSRETERKLLRLQVRVSLRGAVAALKDEARATSLPRLFTESLWLKEYQPLWLTNNQAPLPSTEPRVRLTLDSNLGLIIK